MSPDRYGLLLATFDMIDSKASTSRYEQAVLQWLCLLLQGNTELLGKMSNLIAILGGPTMFYITTLLYSILTTQMALQL